MTERRVELERLLPALVAPFQPSQENNEVEVFGIDRRSLVVSSIKDEPSPEGKKFVADVDPDTVSLSQVPLCTVTTVSPENLVCGICLDDLPLTTLTLCGSTSCATLCNKCIQSYVSDKIASSFGVCAPIRCVGLKCKALIPFKTWKTLLPPAVVQKYIKNASDILTLQCGGCHRRGTLFEPYPYDQTCEKKDLQRLAKASEALTDTLKKAKEAASVEQLLGMLPKFTTGEINASVVLKQLDTTLASDLKYPEGIPTYEQVQAQLTTEREELAAAKARLLQFDNSVEQARKTTELADMRLKLKGLANEVKAAKMAKDRAEHAMMRRQMKKNLAAQVLLEGSLEEGRASEVSSNSGISRRRLVFSDVEVFVPLNRQQTDEQQQSQVQSSSLSVSSQASAVSTPLAFHIPATSSSSSSVATSSSPSLLPSATSIVALSQPSVSSSAATTVLPNDSAAFVSTNGPNFSSSFIPSWTPFDSSNPPTFSASFAPSFTVPPNNNNKVNSIKKEEETEQFGLPLSAENKDNSMRERKLSENESPPSSPSISPATVTEFKEAVSLRNLEAKLAELQNDYDKKRMDDAKERVDLLTSLRINARVAHIGVLQVQAAELYRDPLKLEVIFAALLDLLDDVERRAALQLSYYLRYPKVLSKCCSRIHCFKCKTQGFHDGKTCEEVQPVSEVKPCPGCNVSLLKGDGCSSVTCVCGHNFNWASAPLAPVAPVAIEAPPAPPAPPMQAAPDWECRACTFLNGLQRTECEICLTPRPRDQL